MVVVGVGVSGVCVAELPGCVPVVWSWGVWVVTGAGVLAIGPVGVVGVVAP
jgi:hypothetical protein